MSIRQGSWFSNSNLTLETIILLTYFYVNRTEQEYVKHRLGISHTTIMDWYNFSREVCISILEKFSQQIGGPGKVVEIDKSKFGKRKYHKGRRVYGVCVFAGLERETKNWYFKCVSDRTANTLISIIKEHILTGTTIYSDCWKAYSSLNSDDLSNLAVMHQSFVSTAPFGARISGAFNFSFFKATLKALLSGAKIVVKSLLKVPALPGADNNKEQQMT